MLEGKGEVLHFGNAKRNAMGDKKVCIAIELRKVRAHRNRSDVEWKGERKSKRDCLEFSGCF